ncbi:DUF512 domain-containing protein [Pelotalea chapellei]|uniref:DUF512 domain-containing protein n=1 Tax=Pelotalea chapellei TaxID=44671 RepID=A0ABS5U6F5_9BACT|nr:DUF512 domain-containing protein [Pelotalea chapellei]MBT1071248.1 DUF512 domain-containing protein [Pelotalea chapellei]
MSGLVIESVLPGSVMEEMGVEAGDRLLAINAHPLRDIIDYSYLVADNEQLELEIERKDGELWELEIERESHEPLGLTFPAPQPVRCRNNCVFCFVHQLPKGLRRPLYVKDEDYRLSFLNGNYVTLANLTPAELDRIVEQRLSPLYISVHATNPDLRARLLGRKRIPPILDQLRTLAENRITMHTQVVLCPGLNDGNELERTVTDLAGLYPAVQSLAIVPLGLTGHRQHLPLLQPVESEYARNFIAVWQSRSEQLAHELGEPFLFLADEFFLKAGIPFPPLRKYGDLPQIENGVGMVPLFMRDAKLTLRKARPVGPYRATIVTGASAFGFVSDFLVLLGEKTGLELVPVAVENRLFGEQVTVSGLVTGNDIVAALDGLPVGDRLMVPDVMLKEGEGIFLDGMSLEELGQHLGCVATAFEASPQGLYRSLGSLRRH